MIRIIRLYLRMARPSSLRPYSQVNTRGDNAQHSTEKATKAQGKTLCLSPDAGITLRTALLYYFRALPARNSYFFTTSRLGKPLYANKSPAVTSQATGYHPRSIAINNDNIQAYTALQHQRQYNQPALY